MLKAISYLLIGLPLLSFSYDGKPTANKKATALKINSKITIDGILDEKEWSRAIAATDFIQSNPIQDAAPTFDTEVKFLYDDNALYVGAFMHDTSPDSILKQLGDRDDRLNADLFRLVLDTYNKKVDAFNFIVSASGVQGDSRFSDGTYNAVWDSKVSITTNGWYVEMKIPYSALRFPANDVQDWGLQITRELRRKRESTQWCLTPRGEENFMTFWGNLEGIQDIEPPIRLSLSPYLSFYGQHYPYNSSTTKNLTTGISGGLDLKYGINDGITLDMTLLPDFSAVQSDNLVKNLGAFEVIYDENRPFFQEGTDLFSYGELFYSRRIGGSPINNNALYDEMEEGDIITSSTSKTKLLNASKISGRTSNGIGIGLFNSVVAPSFGEIEKVNGELVNIETSPLTNYNIAVVDKNLGNNNNIYLINTNVTRKGSTYDANVTGTGFTFYNKKSTYRAIGDVAYSQLSNQSLDGVQYYTGIDKTNGKYKFSLTSSGRNKEFNANDLGTTFQTGIRNHRVSFRHGVFEPLWIFNNGGNELTVNADQQWDSTQINRVNYRIHNYGLIAKSFTFMWFGGSITPNSYYDYYEPRVAGRFIKLPGDENVYIGVSTDYRKKLALDGNFSFTNSKWFVTAKLVNYNITPIVRVNDKLQLSHDFSQSFIRKFTGFAAFDADNNSIFGVRNNEVITNTFKAKYIFKNNLSLSLRARHYWSEGTYDDFYVLNDDGTLSASDYSENEDFSFNVFNIDAVFNWQFAPGSNLSVTYQNSIIDGNATVYESYLRNIQHTFQQAQTNSLNIKFLYYLDYLSLKNNSRKS